MTSAALDPFSGPVWVATSQNGTSWGFAGGKGGSREDSPCEKSAPFPRHSDQLPTAAYGWETLGTRFFGSILGLGCMPCTTAASRPQGSVAVASWQWIRLRNHGCEAPSWIMLWVHTEPLRIARRNRIWLLAVSTVCFAAVANVQNPDDVRLLIDETNAPVSHAQPQLAPLACQHLYVARARLGKPFDGLLHLVPVAVWQPFQIPGRVRAKQDSLHAPLRRSCSNGMSGDASAKDDATEARSSSVSGSSSSGAVKIASSTGSANARRILRAAGTSLSGMWSTRVCNSWRSISAITPPLSSLPPLCRHSRIGVEARLYLAMSRSGMASGR